MSLLGTAQNGCFHSWRFHPSDWPLRWNTCIDTRSCALSLDVVETLPLSKPSAFKSHHSCIWTRCCRTTPGPNISSLYSQSFHSSLFCTWPFFLLVCLCFSFSRHQLSAFPVGLCLFDVEVRLREFRNEYLKRAQSGDGQIQNGSSVLCLQSFSPPALQPQALLLP